MPLRPVLLALVVVLTACGTSRGSPEQVCAEATPGAATGECNDFGEGEGPLDD